MLNRRQLLWTGAAAAAVAAMPMARRSARAAAPGQPRNLIIVLANGGWDTSYSIDPKPPGGGVDVPAGTIVNHGAPGREIDILEDPSRPSVGGFFTRFAGMTAVVRGIRMASVSHAACTQAILTGARNEQSPDVAAIVAQAHGPGLPIPYLVLGDNAFAGPYAASMGRVGQTNQLVGLLDPAQAYPLDQRGRAFAPDATDEAAIRAYTEARAERVRATRGATGYNRRRVDDFVGSLSRGDRLRELRAGLGTRGTQLDLVGQRTLALDALATGVSQTVMMSSQRFWDTHDINTEQSDSHEFVFAQLTALAADLEARNMLDSTVIAVISEMGRTPRLNDSGGKDHWPVTSALVFGGGITGGVYGATSSAGEAEPCDFATGQPSAGGRTIEPKHFAAGVLAACGVDPAAHLPEAEAFDAFVA